MTKPLSFTQETRINTYNNTISRKQHNVLRTTIDPNSDFGIRTEDKAKRILSALNRGQANTSLRRDYTSIEADNLMGIVAEEVFKHILRLRYGPNITKEVIYRSSANQIDIALSNGKTIEVRSSCVRNGIDFALFSANRYNPEEQYVDILGPYSNRYKPGETPKDYYVRALYEYNSPREFLVRWSWGLPVTVYITGGVNLDMMNNPKYYQIKNMAPKNKNCLTKSCYRVVPIGKSKDIVEFFIMLEEENPEYVIREIKVS